MKKPELIALARKKGSNKTDEEFDNLTKKQIIEELKK